MTKSKKSPRQGILARRRERTQKGLEQAELFRGQTAPGLRASELAGRGYAGPQASKQKERFRTRKLHSTAAKKASGWTAQRGQPLHHSF